MLTTEIEGKIGGQATNTGELSIIWEEADQGIEDQSQESEIYIHTLTGTDGLHTLSIQGMKGNRNLRMLIDSGSTHNFVSLSTARALGLQTQPCVAVRVVVPNGAKLNCDQIVNKLIWNMAGEKFEASLLVLTIGGYDVILGVDWMKLVSPVVFDFQHNNVIVSWNNKRIRLGQKARVTALTVVPENMKGKWVHKDDSYFLIQVMAVTKTSPPEAIPKEVNKVFEEFADVFAEPKGLPPQRSHDHIIFLKTDSSPVNSNPYSCPYVHKSEIERIVKENVRMWYCKA